MLNRSQEQLLLEGANLFLITLPGDALARCTIFIEEIQRWSKIVDLLSQTDPETIIRKHIIDSFSLLPLIPSGSRVLDLGSGAGFPGIPIATANPNIQATLIEARRKRANFLKEVIRTLNLHNSRAYEGRAEKLAEEKGWQIGFDVVVTRATWNITTFLHFANPFLRRNGTAIAMKGPKSQEELTELEESRESQEFSSPTIMPYSLPGNEKRTLAIFTKISPAEYVSRKT